MASIVQRKSANGEAIWYVLYKIEGHWMRKSLETSNKTLAQRALNKYHYLEDEDRLDLIVNKKKDISLGEFLKVHLQHAEQKLSPKWYHDKNLFFKNQIVHFLRFHNSA